MKKQFEKYLKGIFLTSFASLMGISDGKASKITLPMLNTDIGEEFTSNKNSVRSSYPKFILKMSDDDSYSLSAHSSHSSHSSHYSHSSHRSSSGGGYSTGSSPSYFYSPSGTATTAKIYNLGDRVISYGASGKDVKELADYLIRYGYLKKDDLDVLGSGDITFNLKMEDAIKQFQKDCGLFVDGKAGTSTINFIKMYQTDSYKDLGDRVLKSGMRGTDVTQLINILIDKKYLHGPLLKGSSLFDESVRIAVVAFQIATGIDADGIVNTQTVYFLKK
jgi:hypothetical protein